MMSVISEDEADKYRDLYRMETMYIDLLTGIRDMRSQGRLDDFWRDVVLDNAKEFLAKLPEIIKALEEGRVP